MTRVGVQFTFVSDSPIEQKGDDEREGKAGADTPRRKRQVHAVRMLTALRGGEGEHRSEIRRAEFLGPGLG